MGDLLSWYVVSDLVEAVEKHRPDAERFVAEDDVLSVDAVAFAQAVVGLFPDGAVGVTARRLWRRALCIACVARSIVGRIGHADPDTAFRTGLLRDVGCFILSTCAPLACADALSTAAQEDVSLDAALFDACGTGLYEAGDHLRQAWGLPEADAVSAAAVDLAAWLVDHRRMRLPGGHADPVLDETVWAQLGLAPETLADLLEGLTIDADRARRLYRAARSG